MYRREGGVDFLMVVSQNFRHQSEGDGVVVKDRGYAKEKAIKRFISYNYRLLSYFILLSVTKIQSFIKYDR